VCTADCSTNGGNRIRNSILTPYGNAANGRAIAKVFATNLINSANLSHRAVFEILVHSPQSRPARHIQSDNEKQTARKQNVLHRNRRVLRGFDEVTARSGQ